ncbi:F0F1 ATP synthase subunit B [Prosthecomicrobium sp. N25]|uniref:F0F1 ATP synthase subunit B n=1 Tax=Prosthecomicrobium sp. N25 TaxID=3129254 RepID=UPI00307864F0
MATPTHTTAEVGHGGGEAHSAAFPPFDSSTFASQLFWLALTFGVFYWLLSTKVIPRIHKILEARSDRIARDLEEAQRLKAETDAAIAGYERSLSEARRKAQGIAAENRVALTAQMDAQRAAAEESLAGKTTEAEARIAEIKAKAMADVGTIATEAAADVVAALSKIQPSRDEVAAAVDAALAK